MHLANNHIKGKGGGWEVGAIKRSKSGVKSQQMPFNLHLLAAPNQTCIILRQTFSNNFNFALQAFLISDSRPSLSVLLGEVNYYVVEFQAILKRGGLKIAK